MKITIGKPSPIVRGGRFEDLGWGPYQFATPYVCNDGIAVAIHVGEDSIKSYGDGKLWFVTKDKGATWQQVSADVMADCGTKLPSGDKIYFPRTNAISLDGYKIPLPTAMTPGTDMTKKAEEGTLPQQDGMTYWMGGTTIRAYKADRLPPSLDKKQWFMVRKKADGTVAEEYCDLVWPDLTRVVFSDANYQDCHMKGIYPTGIPKIGPDGAIWITAFSGEGHIDPATKQYSPYYSAEIFRSEDNGHTFVQHAHMEYPADGKKYPYASGGFSDNEISFFDDGSICWFFRSAWFGTTGYEWAPMYMARSTDMGKTWSDPEVFSFTGIYPSLCKLKCGVTLVCFARPGMFISACDNSDSTKWSEPIELMTPGDRSMLANDPKKELEFHDWDGACNNAVLVPVDDHSALIFNTDCYYPDENGVKRKTPFCQLITVEK